MTTWIAMYKGITIEVSADTSMLAGDKAAELLCDHHGLRADPLTIDLQIKPETQSGIADPNYAAPAALLFAYAVHFRSAMPYWQDLLLTPTKSQIYNKFTNERLIIDWTDGFPGQTTISICDHRAFLVGNALGVDTLTARMCCATMKYINAGSDRPVLQMLEDTWDTLVAIPFARKYEGEYVKIDCNIMAKLKDIQGGLNLSNLTNISIDLPYIGYVVIYNQ